MSHSDRQRIRYRFDRAADRYAEAAILHAEVERRVLTRLDWIKLQPERILDAGCGPGRGARLLQAKYPTAHCLALDWSPGMLRQLRPTRRSRFPLAWRRKRAHPTPTPVCADMARIPLRDHCVDLLYSGISLHWVTDHPALFREFRRVLRPGGLLMFTTVGPDTLHELRTAWAAVDDRMHVNRFPDLHDLGDALLAAGLRDPVTDVERFTLTYDDPLNVLRDLRAIGADTILGEHRATLTGPQRIRAMAQAYRTLETDGRVPATWEIVYGSAWMGEAAAPGAVSVAFQGL